VIYFTPEPERARTRLGMATMAIDVAALLPAAQRDLVARFVEAGCLLVRRQPIGITAERQWHQASVALLQGRLLWREADHHLRHALDRYPRDPRLRLARAVAAEQLAMLDLVRVGESFDYRDPIRAATPRSRYQDAQQFESVRAEATIRLAQLLLRLNRMEPALEQLDSPAAATDDGYLRYLADLIRGQALERLDRYADAAEAYRAAALTVPGAQTAAMAEVAALARAGRHDAAVVAAVEATRREPVPDPFLSYGDGDYRLWPALMADLREALR
jgi:tetratricopeptide (TPR) repeat protein